MKTVLFILFFCASSFHFFGQENHIITINGKDFPIEANKEFTYITENGETVKFQLKADGSTQQIPQPQAKSTVNTTIKSEVFENELIKFTYPSNYAIAQTQPVNEMQQITMISGQGGGIIIQQFSSLNPKNLVDFYLAQLVGSTNAENAQKVNTTISGKKIKGKFARDNENNKVVIYSYGKEKQGFLLALIGDDNSDELLRNFLQNFIIK